MSCKCPVCEEEFYSKAVMRSHMKDIHPKKYEKTKNFVTVECSFCGSEFEKEKKETEKVSYNNFCNRNCQIGWLKTEGSGSGDYANNWKEVRSDYLSTVDGCEVCGGSKQVFRIQVHHINGDKSDNRKSNLKALCPSCHRSEHMSKTRQR